MCLGVVFIMKDVKVCGLVILFGVLVLLGIIELVMFGVNLCYCYVFILVMIGLGLVSVFIVVFNVKVIVLGVVGFLGVVFIKLDSFVMYLIGMVILFVVVFVLLVILGKCV